MKAENRRLAGLIGRSHSGVAWHGPSVLEALAGMDASLAIRKPGSGCVHSIWELVKHIAAWQRVALRSLSGDVYVSLSGDLDWPPVDDESSEAWQRDVQVMTEVNAALTAAVREFPVERLGEIVQGTQHDFYFLLTGIIQHNVYHAGQIAMIKRLLYE